MLTLGPKMNSVCLQGISRAAPSHFYCASSGLRQGLGLRLPMECASLWASVSLPDTQWREYRVRNAYWPQPPPKAPPNFSIPAVKQKSVTGVTLGDVSEGKGKFLS